MPVVSGRHDGRRILVPLIIAHSDDLTLARPCSARGLIDTGATITAISRDIALQLDLLPEGKRIITNTHGQARSTQYRFRFGFLTDRSSEAGQDAPSMPYLLDD